MRVGFYTEAGESELFDNEMFFFLVLLFMNERTFCASARLDRNPSKVAGLLDRRGRCSKPDFLQSQPDARGAALCLFVLYMYITISETYSRISGNYLLAG